MEKHFVLSMGHNVIDRTFLHGNWYAFACLFQHNRNKFFKKFHRYVPLSCIMHVATWDDEDLAYLAMVKRKKELVQRVPKKFVVGTFLCHLEGRETRFAEATRALAGKMSLTVRNLRPRVPEFQPANFICMEWDGGPVTIQYSRVFAEGVSHEITEDGYYYVPMDIRNELMQYAEHFDDPSDSDGEGVTHDDQEPECDPEPPASSSSSSSRKPAPKGPRGVTSKTRVSPPNHGPPRATVV